VVIDDVLRGLRDHWLFCAIGVVVGGAVGNASTYLRTPIYQAEAILAPASTRTTSSLASLLGPLQGIARVPLQLADDTTGLSERVLTILQSRAFTEKFVESHGLAKVLTSRSRLDRWLGRPEPEPSIYGAALSFRTSIVAVRVDTRTSFVTIAVRWSDPEQAAEWANALAAAGNEEARVRAIAEADSAIAYLQEELAAQSAVPIVTAINRLIESQLNNKMLAKTRPQFVFTTLAPALPPLPGAYVSPDRPLTTLVCAIAGGLLALMIVLRRRT
jgi:uncharacterized protein involved in exopolysaccharide biosynthesis